MPVTRTLARRRSGRSASSCSLDRLEARTLFSTTLSSWALPSGVDLAPYSGLTVGNNTLYLSDAEGNIDALAKGADGTMTAVSYSTAGHTPTSMVYANGHVYFADQASNGIGELMGDGVVKDLDTGEQSTPVALTVASDGAVWFTTNSVNEDGTINSSVVRIGADDSVRRVDLPTGNVYATYLATGSSGSVWLVEQGVGTTSAVGQVTVSGGGLAVGPTTTIGTITSSIGGIAAAADGSLYALSDGTDTVTDPDQLLHLSVSGNTATQTSAVTLPDAVQGTGLTSLKVDGNGTLWFSEFMGGRIASYNASNGQLSDFDIGYMGSNTDFAVQNGAGGAVDVWSIAFDPSDFSSNPHLANISVSGAASTGFTVAGQPVSGTEDVALAASVAGVNTPVVGRFTGPAGTYSVSIAWGDGTTSAGRIVTGTDGVQYVALASGVSKTFASQGTYTATISVSNGVTTQTATSTVTIGSALSATQNVRLTPLVGRFVLGVVTTFTSAVNAPASQFTATINWGDGTSKGIVIRNPFNPNQFFVLGTHSYHASGNYTIVTTIQNTSLGETATGTATVHV
jgi:streptogramin lyase